MLRCVAWGAGFRFEFFDTHWCLPLYLGMYCSIGCPMLLEQYAKQVGVDHGVIEGLAKSYTSRSIVVIDCKRLQQSRRCMAGNRLQCSWCCAVLPCPPAPSFPFFFPFFFVI